jgi:hypothetical protein
MKKQLLLGTALLAAISAYPQNGRTKAQPSGTYDLAEKLNKKYESLNRAESISPFSATASQPATQNTSAKTSAVNTWNVIAGSMNIFGVLVSESKPLQYNDNLNAVSFIHRKSTTYTPSPAPASNATSGSMVAEISTDWGTTWDSTCFWADNTNWARYPQGAIYNAPATNTANSMSSAYIVGSGPCTSAASSWVGNWYASKQLGTGNYNNAPSTTPGAMQFLATVPTNTAVGKSSFSRIGFASTDDGIVRSIAALNGDDNGTTFATLARRGATVVKGTFNSGVFTWTSDSIICAATLRTDLGKSMGGQPSMAWNEAGTVGYVVFIGMAANATVTTSSNRGWQPIVYKTTNSGASWALINGIDFDNATFAPIKTHIPAIWSSTLANTPVLPQFNTAEGLGLVVDVNDKLHIVSTIVGSGSNHKDSVTAGYSFDAIEKYSWAHTPGERPYVYDFIGDGTGPWTYVTVDSLSSEGAGSATGDPGYAENPWNPDPTASNGKVTSDSRIQAGRTPDGKYVIYSWAESDTNFTNAGKKWNALPDIHVRCLEAANGYTLSPTELIITQSNQGVSSRAMFHYMSPTTSSASITGFTASANNTITINTPFTVSNSLPYSQLTNNRHWYNTAELKFKTAANPTTPPPTQTFVAIPENALDAANASIIYPNPAQNNATLLVGLSDNSNVSITVMSITGQIVKNTVSQGQIGSNNINFDLSGLATGIYMVNVKVGEVSSTKKLIIE